MASEYETSGVEYSQLNVEEVEPMPLRKCPYCKGLCNFDFGTNVEDHGHLKCLDKCQNCGRYSYYEVNKNDRNIVRDSYPKSDINIDEELPPEVKTAFQEAVTALENGIWNGCVVMCRRALEEAMKDLNAKGEDLFKQIDYLENEKRITPELKQWANEGRLGGKLGAHGIKDKKWADKDDAEEVLEFCKWFFRYIYVLPKQLAQRKERLAEEAETKP